jgi:hypothetical protein
MGYIAMMADPLSIYLSDHLAGAVAGLTMMETLAKEAGDSPLAAKLTQLVAEVREDRDLLQETLDRLDSHPNRLAQAAAWVSEKAGEGRLALSSRSHPALGLMQGLEAIALGLRGKRAVFRVLAELGPGDSRLSGRPYAAREARTAAQEAMVEEERLAAARAAFTGKPSSGPSA